MLQLKNVINRTGHKIRHVAAFLSTRLSRVEVELVVLIILAFFSPWWGIDRTMPWQKIWGNQVSWADRYAVIKIIDKKQESAISLQVKGEQVAEVVPKDVGILYDTESLFRTLYADQAPAERITRSLSNVTEVPLATYDEALSAFTEELATQIEVAPEDARIEYVDAEARIIPEKLGVAVDRDQIKLAITAAVAQAKPSAEILTTVAKPDVLTGDLAQKLNDLDSLSTRQPLAIVVGDDTLSMSSAVLANLIDTQKINSAEPLQLSQGLVEDYVKNIIAPRVAKKGVPERIITVDRVVEQTTAGVSGRILDEEALVEAILKAFLEGDTSVKGATIAASEGTVAEKRYSKSGIGLQYLLEDWDNEVGGDWGVYIQDDTTNAISGTLNPDKKFVTASIYKLYVAAYTYAQIEKGELSKDDATALSRSVGDCVRVMIVVSDNSCPSYFFDRFGYGILQQYVEANGYSATDLDNSSGGDKFTTARDTMKLLNDIAENRIISGSSEGELRSFMSQQIYRSGIPKGISGKVVEDKVGFLYGYNHDVGYVRGEKPYTIVILSNGSNYSAIAELAKRLDTVMSK